MNFLKTIYRYVFPKVTYEWCVIGNTMGKHYWKLDKIKCKNGYPVIAGGLITVYKCGSLETAINLLKDFREIAEKINKEKYN